METPPQALGNVRARPPLLRAPAGRRSGTAPPDRKARGGGEAGQTLIFGVLAMVLLLLAIIFLFDLTNIIRLKVRSQTAADSAALAAATWQMHTLNLVGELNLVKAAAVLATDIPPELTLSDRATFEALPPAAQQAYVEAQRASLSASEALVTEMQARLAFVGPLVGFGAAQQAAKNNGLPSTIANNGVLERHIALLMAEDGPYGAALVDQEIPGAPGVSGDGYAWRTAYASMLQRLLAQEVAVSTNATFVNAPRLEGDDAMITAALQSRRFYEAVNAKDWCGLVAMLRREEEEPDVYSGRWWGDLEVAMDSSGFPEESEYLPVDMVFTGGEGDYDDALDAGALACAGGRTGHAPVKTSGADVFTDANGNRMLDSGGKAIVDYLPDVRWASYGSTWADHAPAAEWTDGTYLNASMRREFIYGGAVAAVLASSRPTTITGLWGWRRGRTLAESDTGSLGKALSFSDRKVWLDPDNEAMSFQDTGQRLSAAERQMRGGALDDVKATSVAKPLGQITPEGEAPATPNSVSMILPVFDKATVIPIAMDPRGLDSFLDWKWFLWITECLPEMGRFSAVADFAAWVRAAFGAEFDFYLAALESWDTPAFRAEGRQWLDQPYYIWVTEQIGVDKDGNPIFGRVRKQDGVNEDHCDPPEGDRPGAPGPDRLM